MGSTGGRPPAFDADAYKDRNSVERTISRLKDFRAVAMRTDKREFVFRGTIDVVSIKIWLRPPEKQDPLDTPYWAVPSGRTVRKRGSPCARSGSGVAVAALRGCDRAAADFMPVGCVSPVGGRANSMGVVRWPTFMG
jgi:hypothetical protein